MANTKNYTEHGGSTTHIGGELVLDPGSKVIKDGQEIDIGGGSGINVVHATFKEGSDVDMEIDVPYEDIFKNPSSYIITIDDDGSVNFYYRLAYADQSRATYQNMEIDNNAIVVAGVVVFNEDDHVVYGETSVDLN